MAVRETTDKVPTMARDPESPEDLIDLGMVVGREVSCETEDCPDNGIWKLIQNNGNVVICGVCSQIIDTNLPTQE